MDISGINSAPYGMTETSRTAVSGSSNFGNLVASNVNGLQTEKLETEEQEQASLGLSFPGQLSREEQQRIEILKNQAMQIASQAEGSLTPGEQAQIKAIEQEIGDIGGMPMTENLTDKAKGIAEANRAEAQLKTNDDEAQGMAEDYQIDLSGETADKGQPGAGMLRQQALVTAIKSLGTSGSSAFAG